MMQEKVLCVTISLCLFVRLVVKSKGCCVQKTTEKNIKAKKGRRLLEKKKKKKKKKKKTS